MIENDDESKDGNINESQSLIDIKETIEKNRLKKIFNRLSSNLESDQKSLNDILEEYLMYDDNKIKEINDVNKCFLTFIFYFFLPIICTINLTGIFIIISIYNALWDLFKSSGSYYIEITDEIPNYNFYDSFFKGSLNEKIDFKLTMFWNFVGLILIKGCGFRWTSIIFLFINILIGIAIYNFDFMDYNAGTNDYSFSKLIYLFFITSSYSFTVGCSSLLSQQKLIENLTILKEKKTKDQNKIKNKQKGNSIEMKENPENINFPDNTNYYDNTTYINSLNDNGDNISIISNNSIKSNKSNNSNNQENNDLQKRYSEIINELKNLKNLAKGKDRNETILIMKNKTIKQKVLRKKMKNENPENELSFFAMLCITTFLGYLFKYIIINIWLSKLKYRYEKNYNKNDINYNNTSDNEVFDKIYTHDKNLFNNLLIIYYICILLSVLLYCLFNCIFSKVETSNKKKICFIFKIFGCVIYSEKIETENSTSNNKNCCCKYFKLFCESIKNYCDEIVCFVCCLCCNNKSKCPNCLCEYNEKDYDKNHECFTYIYREKTCSDWINKFISNEIQKAIMPYLLEYFFIQLITISFEKKYENIKKEMEFDLIENIIFLLTLFFTFCIFIFMSIFLGTMLKKMKKKYKEQKDRFYILSNEILSGIHFILFLNSIVSLIFSVSKIKIFNFIIYGVILFNRYIFLALNFFIISIYKKKKDIELLSGSALINIYISIIDIIISKISQKIESENILYAVQIAFSLLLIIIIIVYIVILIKEICNYFKENNHLYCGLCLCGRGFCLFDYCCCNEDSCCYCSCCYNNCFEIICC